MENIGPFQKKMPRADTHARHRWPKPDFVRRTLAREEVHAYYVALISSRTLVVDVTGQRLKAS